MATPAGETKVTVAPATGGLVMSPAISRTVSIPAAAHRTELQPVIATRALFLNHNAAGQQVVSTEPAPQLDWINSLQIAPMQGVQVEDLRFEATPVDSSKNPTYGSRNRPMQQGVLEKVTFQIGAGAR